MIKTIQKWGAVIRHDALLLWFARKHPDTPLLTKVFCAATLLYAISPVDLVPDVIPILGFVDDVIVVPILMWLAIRILPSSVATACATQAEEWMRKRVAAGKSYLMCVLVAVLTVALWFTVIFLIWRSI